MHFPNAGSRQLWSYVSKMLFSNDKLFGDHIILRRTYPKEHLRYQHKYQNREQLKNLLEPSLLECFCLTSLSISAFKQVLKSQWDIPIAWLGSTGTQWWRTLKLNNRSAQMMSGSASAHIPIIIWLSSVAVFSAPFTDNSTKRRGKTGKLSATCLWIFFSQDNKSLQLFFFQWRR